MNHIDDKLNRIANPLANLQMQKILNDYSELTSAISHYYLSIEPVLKSIEPVLHSIDPVLRDIANPLSKSYQIFADQLSSYRQMFSGIEASVAALEPILRIQHELFSAFTPAYLTEVQRVFSNVQRVIDFDAFNSFVASARLSADFAKSLEMAQPFMDEEQTIECEQLFEVPSTDIAPTFSSKEKLSFSDCLNLIGLLFTIITSIMSFRSDPQMDELIELQKAENEIASEQLTIEKEQLELTKEQTELLQQVLDLMETFNDEIEALPMDGDELLNQIDTLDEDKHLIIDQTESPKDTDTQNNDNTDLESY